VAENFEGTETAEPEGFVVKISGRIDRKVDGDKVQELAAEFGLTDHLAKLFRWKPELNMAIWKATDATITGPLAGAITAKPGRPSFKIIPKE
jgi:predicted fused transcriptional regulator/phosphomethylpyrimidine kinase